ncbi:MAG: ABC transporter permease, partial [Deltaproteobacteria bacterium]|nr:ABC transporter permease [Deltaproteobacteria bacterium]
LEAGLSGLVGGLVGCFGGLGIAQFLAARTFSLGGTDLSASLQWVIFSITLILAVAVAQLGSFFPVRGAMRLDPVRTLKEN